MVVPSHVFREYDVRGTVPDELTPAFAEGLGAALASRTQAQVGGPPRFVIGRDNRPSGESLAVAFGEGVCRAGGSVIDIGAVPTPALYFATHHLPCDGGVQITGSHNPPEFNGFKMVVVGESVHGAAIQELKACMERGSPASDARGERTPHEGILASYRDAIVSRHHLARPVRVVVDCGNGIASVIAVETLEALGAEVIPLFCESDGTFPNHHPDPTVPENLRDLQEAVLRSHAELGIAFDGDGDRIGAVDERGDIVVGDQLLLIFGRDAVDRFGPGISVIFDVKCSDLLTTLLSAAGAHPVMWKTGHSLIKAKMQELDAPLAGEMSGHMFFGGDYFGYDDALFAAARLLERIAKGPQGLHSLLADVPQSFATPELRIPCPDEEKFAIVADASDYFASRYNVNTIDGVRIAFPHGWGLLRASNTQPVLVARFEAQSAEALGVYRSEVTAWLQDQGIETG